MKRNLMILVALFTMLVIPWNVKADLQNLINQGDYKCTTENDSKTKKKITTCQIAYKNTGTTEFKGGSLTLTLKPKHSSTTVSFVVNSTDAKQNSASNNVYVLAVEPIPAGETAILGTVKWSADATLTDADCGGDIIPEWKSTSSEETGSDDGEITDTGYAVPTLALAIGAIGVVTVLATSKKKTKMYKI